MVTRRVFFSFNYKADNWRASQVRNMGAIEGNLAASDNDWEKITAAGDEAIKRWINAQMKGRTCTVVLVGANTAGRKWIKYEIKKSWLDGKGLLGICIHNLVNSKGDNSSKGRNPFSGFKVGEEKLSNIVKLYDPPYTTSKNAYDYIKKNIADWIKDAIEIRKLYN